MRSLLSKEQAEYLRERALGKSVKECTDALNTHFGTSFTVSQIRSYKSNHHISSGKAPWEFADYSKLKITTEEQEKWIRENYKGIGNRELTERFNSHFGTSFTTAQIKAYKQRNHLDSGLTGHFGEGSVSYNKGKKGMCAKGCEKSWFGKGHMPANTDPIGTEKKLSDGYIWVKIDDKPKARKTENWKQKHRLLWEKHNGPIPEGYRLVFADGDRTHIALDNLILMSNSESLIMNRHGLIKDDPELTMTGAVVAKVIDTVNKKEKKRNGKNK